MRRSHYYNDITVTMAAQMEDYERRLPDGSVIIRRCPVFSVSFQQGDAAILFSRDSMSIFDDVARLLRGDIKKLQYVARSSCGDNVLLSYSPPEAGGKALHQISLDAFGCDRVAAWIKETVCNDPVRIIDRETFISIVDWIVLSVSGLVDPIMVDVPIGPVSITRVGNDITHMVIDGLSSLYCDGSLRDDFADLDCALVDSDYVDFDFMTPGSPLNGPGIAIRTLVGILYGIYIYGWRDYYLGKLPPASQLYSDFCNDDDLPLHLRLAVANLLP